MGPESFWGVRFEIAIGQPITNQPQQLEVTTSWHSQPFILFSL
jgi:hypothetical protein